MQSESPTPAPEHNAHPAYRADIDGLRALAILSVVIFHAFPSKMKGGFIGVDIFFVISGFLISSIIFRSLQRDDFSFAEFYAHRIKRIFPALILVLVAAFAFGWFALLPDELKQLGKHMAAGAGFVQNFVLWREAGYFDSASELKPLMHLWSLAIEEQFYLIYPVLVWAIWRLGLNVLTAVFLLGLLSFGLNVSGISRDVVGTFFSPQTRFWELLAGAMLAYVQSFKSPRVSDGLKDWVCYPLLVHMQARRGARLNSILSIVGFLLIVAAVFGINKGKAFPGWWAVFPVLGASLLILAGADAWVNRNVLASRVMVFVGLISYPLYLWHWPILSFARIGYSEMPPVGVRVAAVALSFLLAWLTYRLVERPIRFGPSSRTKMVALSCLLAIVGYGGFSTYQHGGFGFRFAKLAPEYAREIAKIADAWAFRDYPTPAGSYFDPRYGFLSVGSNEANKVLFVGDSHVQQYWNSVAAVQQRNPPDAPMAMFADLGLPPKFSEELLADTTIKTVVFSYYWAYKYGSDKVNQPMRCCGGGKGGTMGYYDLPLKAPQEMDQIDRELKRVVESLKKLGRQVYFVLDNPFGEELDPHSKLTRGVLGNFRITVLPPLRRDVAIERSEPVRSRIVRVAYEAGAEVIDPFEFLCDQQVCPAFSKDGELLYKDYDHVSLHAALHHIRYLDPILMRAGEAGRSRQD